MIRKLLSLLLALCLLCAGCFAEPELSAPTFRGMNDPALLPYIEDTLYTELIDELNSEDYLIENVNAIFISQEYLDELAFNSQANIFFGYTLAELDAQFEGTRYVFTLGDNEETIVVPFEAYQDNTYIQVLRNVAVGAGVILVCVTVSAATYVSAPAVSIIFACAAETGTAFAVAHAKWGFLSAGILHYIQTGNLEDSFKAGLLAGSEGFKWGAIGGAVVGDLSETLFLHNWHRQTNITWSEAAQIQREGRYSLEFIEKVHSMDEYKVYKEAGLIEYRIGDKSILLPKDFDFDFIDPKTGLTNRELMRQGYNPVDSSGIKYEWHHVGQKNGAPLALLTREQHDDPSLHYLTHSDVDHGLAWDKLKTQVNNAIAKGFN